MKDAMEEFTTCKSRIEELQHLVTDSNRHIKQSSSDQKTKEEIIRRLRQSVFRQEQKIDTIRARGSNAEITEQLRAMSERSVDIEASLAEKVGFAYTEQMTTFADPNP